MHSATLTRRPNQGNKRLFANDRPLKRFIDERASGQLRYSQNLYYPSGRDHLANSSGQKIQLSLSAAHRRVNALEKAKAILCYRTSRQNILPDQKLGLRRSG